VNTVCRFIIGCSKLIYGVIFPGKIGLIGFVGIHYWRRFTSRMYCIVLLARETHSRLISQNITK